MKAQIQWTITAFYTGTIYDTLMFQLCTQHFSTTTVLGVLGFSLFVFLLFGIHRISLCKIAAGGRTISIYMHINFYNLYKTPTRWIQKSRFSQSPCTQAKQAGTVLCLSLVFCYFQFFIWCILFADLSRHAWKFKFCTRLLVSDSPGKSMHISILYARTFIFIL